MNPVVFAHFAAAVLAMLVAVPLIRRKVPMNPWYGVRIPATFASEQAWFDTNHYAGRLLFNWGLTIVGMAIVGAFLGKEDWIAYNWTSLILIMSGLAVVVVKALKYAAKTKRS